MHQAQFCSHTATECIKVLLLCKSPSYHRVVATLCQGTAERAVHGFTKYPDLHVLLNPGLISYKHGHKTHQRD